jgi:hypothetical protein
VWRIQNSKWQWPLGSPFFLGVCNFEHLWAAVACVPKWGLLYFVGAAPVRGKGCAHRKVYSVRGEADVVMTSVTPSSGHRTLERLPNDTRLEAGVYKGEQNRAAKSHHGPAYLERFSPQEDYARFRFAGNDCHVRRTCDNCSRSMNPQNPGCGVNECQF